MIPIEIWVILIPTIGSLLGTFAGVMISSKLTTFRLEQLEDKVNKHNNLVERMVIAENKINSAHNRIDRMKEKELDKEISDQLAQIHRQNMRKKRIVQKQK